MNVVEGSLNVEGLSIGIVVSKFNEQITSKILEGAKVTLLSLGV